jgi:hypothetical protein
MKGTGAVDGAQPRYVHAGVNSVVSTYLTTATSTAGAADVVQMAKIPDGARILDVKVKASGGDNLIAVGDGGDSGRFISTATVSASMASLNVPGGLAYQYDLSDAAIPQHDTIDIAFTGAVVIGTTFTLTTTYEVGT